ncbi:hypothetical protein OPQ81_000990 [Rhizoctonia solani]|nr:hypothetical protein OPQ81_000990 [Rhizoctonia solani]
MILDMENDALRAVRYMRERGYPPKGGQTERLDISVKSLRHRQPLDLINWQILHTCNILIMPRTVRRPTPITLPNCPMDTLWEVDESLEQLPSHPRSRSQPQLRSVFEDDDQVGNVAFPLPPRSLPPIRRFFKMSLPIHSPPRTRSSSRSPPKPTRAPPPVPRPLSPALLVTRPVSPSSSASSSDTEPPRTPPAAPAPLPAYVLAPPPPAEWESAIDALFEFDEEEEEEEVSSKWSSSSSTPRASPIPIIRPTDSYLSFSPPCSPPRLSFMQGAKSPLPPSMSVYASDSLPMSPTFSRPLASPGLMPTSPTSPAQCNWSTAPLRPARSSKRMGTAVPIRIGS